MKKIIAFSVLLALLSAAVFAQDGSGWKVGFRAQLVRDFFYTTKASGESETTISGTGIATTTSTSKLGEYIKGSSNLWTFTNNEGFDNRLILSLSHDGDHHSVYIDAKVDNDWTGDPSLMGIINGGAADWWFKGDTGAAEGAPVVIDGVVGTAGYGGFVPVGEIWDDWTGRNEYNFFGVVRYDGFLASNNMRVIDMVTGAPWGRHYTLGATFAGNYRLAIGSTIGAWPGSDGYNTGSDNPLASTSKIKAGFLLSAKGLGPVTADIFYAVKGGDNNTVKRGTGAWENILGVYVGLAVVENLGLSLGYTANFKADEVQEIDVSGTSGVPYPDYKTYNITNPLWSGVDLNVSYSGIEKLSLGLNNNLSFAGTKVENWFAYKASLKVGYSLTDRLGVALTLRNLLTVYGVEAETKSSITTNNIKGTITTDDLVASIHAEYGVGNVTVGMGLTFGIAGFTADSEDKTTFTGGSGTQTDKGSFNIARFGIPLFFKVAF